MRRPPLPPALWILWLACPLLFQPASAHAGSVEPEVWVGGGMVRASYDDNPMAVVRGGMGAELFHRFSLGVSAQADREHEFFTAYVGLVLPMLGMFEPYGRFHVGRRDDLDDTALGWTGGVRLGDGRVDLFIEAHGIFEPGDSDGASIGIAF